jgi:predicted transcriptional regulator
MISDIAALYKILNDDINKKILMVINENSGLSYTDLMEKSEFYSKELLNHRLNVLSEFLRKNEEDQYMLTEKGQSALKLLEESHEQLKKFGRKKQKQNGVYIGLVYVIILITTLIFYSQGYINRVILLRIVISSSFIIIFLLGTTMRAASLTSESTRKKSVRVYKLIGIVCGGMIGPFIAMIGMLLATVISVYVGGPNFLQDTGDNNVYFYSCISIAIVIGCITGYYTAKKLAKKQLY